MCANIISKNMDVVKYVQQSSMRCERLSLSHSLMPASPPTSSPRSNAIVVYPCCPPLCSNDPSRLTTTKGEQARMGHKCQGRRTFGSWPLLVMLSQPEVRGAGGAESRHGRTSHASPSSACSSHPQLDQCFTLARYRPVLRRSPGAGWLRNAEMA